MSDMRHHRKPLPVSPRAFAWVLIVAGLVGVVHVWGTPHLLFNYVYRKDAMIPSRKHFLACDYVGLSVRRVRPQNGHCPWIAFFEWERGQRYGR